MERMADELTRYLWGWIGHFGKCETPSVLEGLEQWFRRRLRSVIWKQWKRGTGSVRRTLALPNAYFDSLGIPGLTVRPIA